MPTLNDIKKRITSVQNTQKITRAMKMVAAAKLRRAQQSLLNHRPYANKIKDMVHDIMSRSFDEAPHALITPRQIIKNRDALIYTSNRGLCGGFNGNLLRFSETWIKETEQDVQETNLHIIGRKGRDYLTARKFELKNVHLDFAEEITMHDATELAENAISLFLSGKIDEYNIIFNQFVSAVTHEAVKLTLLPITLETETQPKDYGFDFIYEPNKNVLTTQLLKTYVAIQIYRAHLESRAAELGARMAAMENATSNAGDMISHLTLQYNRARQAAITTELMDIVNGAEALQ